MNPSFGMKKKKTTLTELTNLFFSLFVSFFSRFGTKAHVESMSKIED
jgi:hypothetical protein